MPSPLARLFIDSPPMPTTTTANRDHTFGIACVVVASVGFGFMGVFRDWASRGGITSAQTLLALRFTLAGLILVTVMAARRTPWPRGRTLGWLIALGAVGYFGEALCYFKAMEFGVPSGLTAVLLYLYPGFVAILSRVFLRERLSALRIGAIAAAFVGTVLAVGTPGSIAGLSVSGIACGIGSAVMYGLYIVVGALVTKGLDPIASTTVVCLSAAACFCVMTAITGPTWPTAPVGWLGVVSLAVIATVVAVLGIIAGLQRIGPVETSTIATLEALTTVAVGALLLGERLSPLQFVGGGLILAAAVVMARAGGRAESTDQLPTKRMS